MDKIQRVCEMWLNGSAQYEDHLIGKKHRLCTERAKKIEAGIRASVLRTGAIACTVVSLAVLFVGCAILVRALLPCESVGASNLLDSICTGLSEIRLFAERALCGTLVVFMFMGAMQIYAADSRPGRVGSNQ